MNLFEFDTLLELFHPGVLSGTPIYRQLLSEIPESQLIPIETRLTIGIHWKGVK